MEFFQLTASSPQELRLVVADYLLDQNNESLANSIRLAIHQEEEAKETDDGRGTQAPTATTRNTGYGCGLSEGTGSPHLFCNSFGIGDGQATGYGTGYGHGDGHGTGLGTGKG